MFSNVSTENKCFMCQDTRSCKEFILVWPRKQLFRKYMIHWQELMKDWTFAATVTHSVTTNPNFSSDDDDDWEQIMVSVNTVLIDQVTMKNKQKYVMSGDCLQSNNDIWDHFPIFLFAGKMKVSQNKSKKSIEICNHVMQRCLIIWNQWKYLDSSHH